MCDLITSLTKRTIIKMTLKKFSRRFSFSDWSFLLKDDRFETLVMMSKWDEAELRASEIL